MRFNRAFNSIMEKIEDKCILWEYIYELWTSQQKIPSLMSLIASMVLMTHLGRKTMSIRLMKEI